MSNVQDIIIVVTILFVVGISLGFSVYMGKAVLDNLAVSAPIAVHPEAVEILESTSATINKLDYAFFTGFILFFAAIILVGWMVGGIRLFVPIYLILGVVFTFIAVLLQLIYPEIANSIPNMATTLPITNYIVGHIGYICAIFVVLGVFVMYARPEEA